MVSELGLLLTFSVRRVGGGEVAEEAQPEPSQSVTHCVSLGQQLQ